MPLTYHRRQRKTAFVAAFVAYLIALGTFMTGHMSSKTFLLFLCYLGILIAVTVIMLGKLEEKED